jgi:hypothetical protein
MAIQYDVVYVARSPASTRQEDFASQVDEICNGRAAHGWTLLSAVGDYGAKVTLGVWLYFTKEGDDLGSFGSESRSYEEEPVGAGASEEGSGYGGGGYGGDDDGAGDGAGDSGFGGEDSESGGEDIGGDSDEEPS